MRHKTPKLTAFSLLAALMTSTFPHASAQNHPASALRWGEGQPGCTFSADDDGRYRYGLWTDDLGITVAVDAQELQNSLRRVEPLFAVWITVRYRGTGSVSLTPDVILLEFVKHEHAVERSLDPQHLNARLQSNSDTFTEKTRREIQKHPEKKSGEESLMQSHLQNVRETQEIVKSHSLPAAALDPAHAEAGGWVFFNARSRWVGDWKRQEEFVLRIPAGNRVFEFPFALPPSEGDLLLRHRPQN